MISFSSYLDDIVEDIEDGSNTSNIEDTNSAIDWLCLLGKSRQKLLQSYKDSRMNA